MLYNFLIKLLERFMFDRNSNWLLSKWWYITVLAISAILLIVGLFNIFPFLLLGGLGLTTCILAYFRLDKHQKYYGIRLNQYRFKQWWWWVIIFFSLGSLSSSTSTFLLGLFFLLLAFVLLFMPPGGNKVTFR